MSDNYQEIYGQDFQPAKGDAHGWIQWKGTGVCIDLHYICGYHDHFDGEFFYHWECPKCHKKYATGQNVKMIPLTEQQIVDGKVTRFQSGELDLFGGLD